MPKKTKAFWKSKTVMFAFVGLLMSLLEFYGYANEALAILAFLGTVYGRYKATDKITVK